MLQMDASTYCIGLSADATSLQHIYWGPRVAQTVASEMAHAQESSIASFESSIGISREEYAPWGEMRFNEPGLKVEYVDGTRVIEWLFEDHGVERSEASQLLWLRFRDRVYPFVMTLYYRIYDGQDVIERWVRLENSGVSDPIIIEQALSADWRLPRCERYRLTYLYGQHTQGDTDCTGCVGPGEGRARESQRHHKSSVESLGGLGPRRACD